MNTHDTVPARKSITDLFTQAASNQGIELDLLNPDRTPSGVKLTVLGIDSDVFKKALSERNRVGSGIVKLPDHERPEAVRQADAALVASTVTAWDFEEPCTHANVVKLFLAAPDVFEQVNAAAADRARFFKARSKV